MSDIIVGIDLGTTNSAVAIVQDGRPRLLARGDQHLLPSVVGYSAQTGWLVGRPALNQYVLDPDNTVRSIKRKMGSQERIPLAGREFTPQEISAFILRELKTIAEENLGQPVQKAVITVPAYFTDGQRQATQEAGQIAGLDVVRIINEPTAAALAYGLNQEEDQLALVYDLGGGTFDVSLVEMSGGVVEVRASHGDTHLGGDDFDERLAQYAAERFTEKHQVELTGNRRALARLNRAAEAAKRYLSDFPETTLREEYLVERNNKPLHLETEIDRQTFEEMIGDLLQRTTRSIDQVRQDAKLDVRELNRVLLVGGSTRMPAVWNLVADFTQIEPDSEINPDEAVALGAAVQAAIIAGQPVDSILVDVTPYSLGIENVAFIGHNIIPDQYSVLIRRNTTVPVTKEETYYALYPDQESIKIKVYQGESSIASANTLLGDFLIEGLKAAKPGELPSVNVRFDFDVNGMLHVRATDRHTGKQADISLQATQARLSPAEIAQARRQLPAPAALDLLPAGLDLAQETQVLLDRAKALLEAGTLNPDQTASLQALVDKIQAAQQQGNLDEVDELSEELLDHLFDLE